MKKEKKKEATVYRLFAMPVNQNNMKRAIQYRFNRITPTYILIYSNQKEAVPGAVEVKETDVYRLTKQDKDWLFSCCVAQMAELMRREKEQTITKMQDIISSLEKELKEEAEKEGLHRGPKSE